MGISRGLTINLNAYLNVLKRIGFEDNVKELKKIFRLRGIQSSGTFYYGSAVGHGSILYVTKNRWGAISGSFKINARKGFLEAVSGRQIISIPKRHTPGRRKCSNLLAGRFFRLFIAGLYDNSKVKTTLTVMDGIFLRGIMSARGCYDFRSRMLCSYKEIDKIRIWSGFHQLGRICTK